MKNKKTSIFLLAFIVLLLGVLGPDIVRAFGPDDSPFFGITNFDRIYLRDSTSSAPILNVNQTGAGDIVRFQDGGTTVWAISDGGGIAATGDYTNTGRFAIDGAEDEVQLTVQGYTTQTNRTLVVEQSDGTDVLTVDDDGFVRASSSVSTAGTITAASGIDVVGASVINGSLDMSNNPVVNIGVAGTDFLGDGSLQTAQMITVSAGGVQATGDSAINGTLDMSNNPVENIGVAGTDFLGDGSLQTAQIITVAAGGVQVTGDSAINGTLNMSSNPVTNIGNAGTDFGTDGSLTTAQTVTLSAGRLAVNQNGLTVTGVSTFYDYVYLDDTLDMSNNPVVNIGVAGTDFLGDGSLQTAQGITVTAGQLSVNAGGITVTGVSTFYDYVYVEDTVDVAQLSVDTNGITVTGVSTFYDYVYIEDTADVARLSVDTNGITVTGVSTFYDYVYIEDTADVAHLSVDTSGITVTGVSTFYDYVYVENTVDVAQLSVDTNGITVTGVSTFYDRVDLDDTLDMMSNPIVNIGNAGTDFGSDGSLTVLTVTISYGGLDVQADAVTLANDETIENSENGLVTVTVPSAGLFSVEAGNLAVCDAGGSPDLTLNGNDAYIAGTLEADGAARLDGGATVAGDLTMSNGLILPEFDDLTINDGDWLTATTVEVYALDTSAEVTMTLGACSNEGQSLTLIGDDANNINVNYVNLRNTSGAALVLTQYDVLGLVCQDTEWIELYLSVNQ